MEKFRYLASPIASDALAGGKIAMISGPRQVGKSTLAKKLLRSPANYFLYDDEAFRVAWAKSPERSIASRAPGPIVLDKIHKDRRWKSRVKGLYDRLGGELPLVVTGSARLDQYRRGADSLLGRYFPYRLHPFSTAETESAATPEQFLSRSIVSYPWKDLLRLGGFPEPLLGGSEEKAARWSRLRLDRLVLEDSRDLRNISDLNAFRVLAELLPERVGAPLSVYSLHEDVGKAYATVRSWTQVLDSLYFSFLVRPYSKKIARALRAEPKLYLFDVLRIPAQEKAKRLENLAALHLLKMCQYWTDTAQGEFSLHYLRDKERREVDFLVLRDRKPWLAVECKSGKKEPDANLLHFGAMLRPDHLVQLVEEDSYDRVYPANGVRVMGYQKFFSGCV